MATGFFVRTSLANLSQDIPPVWTWRVSWCRAYRCMHIFANMQIVVSGPHAIFTWLAQPVPTVELATVQFCPPVTPSPGGMVM